MLGTLNGALEVRGVSLPADAVRATVKGENYLEGKLPVLKSIVVHYHLKIPRGSREAVERALASHQEKCPTAQSLKAAVEVRWTAEIEEV